MTRAACIGIVIVAAAGLWFASGPAVDAQTGACSREAAVQAMLAAGVITERGQKDPVGEVTCGAFLGPGSQAMAVTIAHGACWPNAGWRVFAFKAGAWQPVPVRGSMRVVSLAVVGSDLRETVPVLREKDSVCIPTGGTAARDWHWNGSRLRAGPLSFVDLPDASSRVDFVSAGRDVTCAIGDQSESIVTAFCRSEKREISATVDRSGHVYICRGSSRSPCIGHPPRSVPSLGYGRTLIAGRFSCSSSRAGIRCTVTRTGKGFAISASRVTRVKRAR